MHGFECRYARTSDETRVRQLGVCLRGRPLDEYKNIVHERPQISFDEARQTLGNKLPDNTELAKSMRRTASKSMQILEGQTYAGFIGQLYSRFAFAFEGYSPSTSHK